MMPTNSSFPNAMFTRLIAKVSLFSFVFSSFLSALSFLFFRIFRAFSIKKDAFFQKSLGIRLAVVLGMSLGLSWQADAAKPKARACLSNRDCRAGEICLRRLCQQKPRFRVQLSGVGTTAFSLAIAPVKWMGPDKGHPVESLKTEILEQLQENFGRLVGTIQVMPTKSFLEKADADGIEIGQFSFSPWQQIAANGLIKVGIRAVDHKRLRLMFRFYDVDSSQQELRFDRSLPPNQLRWALHQYSNAIYRKLTGKEGLFGSYIAYVRRGSKGGKDIWVMDFDGKNRRCVVRNGHINLMPTWSPDGRFLVFTSYLERRPYLYRLDLRTEQLRRISSVRANTTGGAVSPNGKQVAFSLTSPSGSELYMSDIEGKEVQRLTKDWGIHVSPTWSADGRRIAFVSERYATPQIFVMNADGSGQRRLTFKGEYNQEPRWSPTEPEILFTARDEYLKFDLFVVRLERDATGKMTHQYRRLTQNQGKNFEASWSPDGRFILFVSTRSGQRKLYIMNADGSEQRLFLTTKDEVEMPAWSPIIRDPILPGGEAGRSYYRRVRMLPGPPLRDIEITSEGKAPPQLSIPAPSSTTMTPPPAPNGATKPAANPSKKRIATSSPTTSAVSSPR